MIASIATAGASAALAVTAGASNAQGAATTSADPASGTVYTGDTIQGKKVVSALDVNDLEPGTTQGGLVEHLVKLNDKVEADQKVAIQRNSFGEVVAEYTSSVAGEVMAQRSDATSEPGNTLAFILFNKAPPDVDVYPE
jgi:predicted deacylase